MQGSPNICKIHCLSTRFPQRFSLLRTGPEALQKPGTMEGHQNTASASLPPQELKGPFWGLLLKQAWERHLNLGRLVKARSLHQENH